MFPVLDWYKTGSGYVFIDIRAPYIVKVFIATKLPGAGVFLGWIDFQDIFGTAVSRLF